MAPLKNGQPQEEDRYMWGCGRSPHPHIYPSLLLDGIFSVHSFHINLSFVQPLIESYLLRVTKREPMGSLFSGMVVPITLPARYNLARFGRNRNSVECQG